MSSANGNGAPEAEAALLTPRRAAALLGVSVRTLRDRVARGDGPAHYRFASRRIMFRLADLEAYLGRFRVDPPRPEEAAKAVDDVPPGTA